MATPNPIQKFDSLLSSSDFLFVVYYRGHWCPFCMSYLTTFSKLVPSITSSGGTPLIVTSEVPEHLPATRKATSYSGEAIVDPENLLAKHLKEKELLDVAISKKGGYEHDMAQPSILVMRKDGEVLERWAIVPSVMNLAGAKDRPDLEQVWENVQANLNGEKGVHGRYKTQTFFGVMWGKVFG